MYWNWIKGGVILGIVFLLAVIIVKPIGVSTQFVVLDGIIADAINPDLVVEDSNEQLGYSSTNAYLNKSGGKYAKDIAKPMNYSFIFVLSMILGGLIGKVVQKEEQKQIPQVYQDNFGSRKRVRYLMSFIGGLLVLYGARLAGGCTSGHMMSGMMQTSISGYAFAIAAFLAAIPTAIILYKK